METEAASAAAHAAHVDVTGIALTALAAMACGLLMHLLKQPAIVGYIIAGVLLGPSALGLVEDRESVALLAELGVLMLLFIIGLELSVKKFMTVWKQALVTTLLQVGGSVGVMLLMYRFAGWDLGMSVLLGFAVALSSTAVVIKLLEQSGESETPAGRLTIGILIAQDMAVVPMMLALSMLSAPEQVSYLDGARIAAAVLILAGLIWLLLRREVKLPFARTIAAHGDLAPLAAFGLCFGGAAASGLLGLSAGYGAFLAGLVLGNSSIGSRMIHAAHPIQSLLLMVFFLSVGLLLDLDYVWDNLGAVLAVLLWVTLFKTVLNLGALRLLRTPWPEAFLAGVALAQIGEFSFLLSSQGAALGLLDPQEAQFVVAVTVLSLMFSPLWLATLRRLGGGLARRRRMKTLGAVLDTVYGPEARKVGWVSHAAVSRLRGRPAPPPPLEPAEPPPEPAAEPMPAMEAEPAEEPLAPAPAEAYDTAPDQPPLEQEPATVADTDKTADAGETADTDRTRDA
ncbi:cation:proton antiporter [Caenispirillum salinarum]|uniref:cation:proton antiporter n=1 Tax=Caenispirillum salinarum TaxID=859058 RepID=UPI0038509C6D